MSWLKRLWGWLKSVFGRKPRPYRTVDAADIPETLSPREIYLVGENGFLWNAAMLCPCGCGESMQLSCLPDARLRWTVTRHPDSTISLRALSGAHQGLSESFLSTDRPSHLVSGSRELIRLRPPLAMIPVGLFIINRMNTGALVECSSGSSLPSDFMVLC